MPKQNTSQLERANRAATALGYSGVEGARQVIKKRSTQLGMNGTDQNRMTMSADTLNANPTEFAVQDAPPATESGALAGALEKQPDYTKQLAEQAKKAQTGEQKSFQELLNAQLGMEGQTSLTDTQYSQQGGVDDLTKKLNEYDQQLTMEQNATRRRVEQIQKNSVGMSQQALNDEVDRVERESLAKQADISVIRAGVAQDYSTAKAIADRAVTVAMEKQKMKIDVLGLNYTRNKDLFTKAEQRAFESAQTDRTNAYNETLASKKAISDYSLEAMKMGADGATISAIRGAKTPEEAQALAAAYTSPLIQQQNALDVEAKRASINASNALATQRTTTQGMGTGTEYANDMDALVGNVTAMIPTRFGQQQFQKQMASARNDADRLGLAAGQVLKTQPSEVRRDFANQAVGLSEIDRAIKLLDEGTNTGVLQAGAQYAYNLVGKDFDPKLAEINQHLTAAIQPYRNSVTGAAWGTQEDAEYAQLFGSTKYSPDEFRQRLEVLKEVLKNKSATTLNAFANPMGVGENQFASGAYTPNSTQNTTNMSTNDPLGIL